jgi:hypothetical protein
MTHRCSTCKQVKPVDNFNKNRATKSGYHNQCRECQKLWKPSEEQLERYRARTRIWNRKKLTGFTEEQFQQKLQEQNYRCAICGTDDPGVMNWQADHCHDTLSQRGILCHLCNKGLGHFKDNPELLESAIRYLAQYQTITK